MAYAFVGRRAHTTFSGTSRNPFFVKFTLELDREPRKKLGTALLIRKTRVHGIDSTNGSLYSIQRAGRELSCWERYMKNIYIHRLRTHRCLDVLDSNSNYFKDQNAPISALLPDYDEQLQLDYEDHNWRPSESFIALRIKKSERYPDQARRIYFTTNLARRGYFGYRYAMGKLL